MNSLYIEKDSCRNCHRCIRSCEVRAIKYDGNSASILNDRCVECGRCIDQCPFGIIRIPDATTRARHLIKKSGTIVAAISPAWVAEFPGITHHRMIEALKLLGFTAVSETTIAAEKLQQETVKQLSQSSGLYISSLCPVVTSMIIKHHQTLTENIIPLDTPAVIHARMIKQWYGTEAKVVVIDSCVASKELVARYPDLIDTAVTFKELERWFTEEGIDFDFIPGNESYNFEPIAPREATEYVVDRGVYPDNYAEENNLPGLDIFSVSGLRRVNKFLRKISGEKEKLVDRRIFIELLACDGGCLHGEGAIDKSNTLSKKLNIKRYAERNRRNSIVDLPAVLTTTTFTPGISPEEVDDEDIIKTLQSLSIDTDEVLINCAGCGYNGCREFARAVVRGNATTDMCVWYLRRVAQDKFSILLHKMPSGVFVADADMTIVEANRNFASMLGAEAEMVYDANPGMNGADITRLLHFADNVKDILKSGEEIIERDVQIKGHMLRLTLFSLQKNRLVCGIIRNLFHGDIQNDEIVNRTRQVIEDNLETVQKIAYLLGENASRTESILNSIIESQNK